MNQHAAANVGLPPFNRHQSSEPTAAERMAELS